MSATMEDALTEALLWLRDEPAGSQLTEINFGRHSDGSGYWWTLEYRRFVRNGEVRNVMQDDEDRISRVVECWSKLQAELLTRAKVAET